MKKKTGNINPDLRLFFNNFKKAVENTGLTPYSLAVRVGVDKQAISRLLGGDRDPLLSTILRIVKGMQISMDELIGYPSVKISDAPDPNSISKNEPKDENIDLANRISKMHKNDVELLEAIIKVLDERRARAVARLVHAINGKNEKEDILSKASEKGRSLSDGKLDDEDNFEDDEDFEDDDFDDEDDEFEEDDDFDSDDDYEEEDDDFDDE